MFISLLNIQMLNSFSAVKPLRWRVENSTLSPVKCAVKERGVMCGWPQLSARAFLKEFWCVLHRLQLSWSTHHKAMHYGCVCLLTRGAGEAQR